MLLELEIETFSTHITAPARLISFSSSHGFYPHLPSFKLWKTRFLALRMLLNFVNPGFDIAYQKFSDLFPKWTIFRSWFCFLSQKAQFPTKIFHLIQSASFPKPFLHCYLNVQSYLWIEAPNFLVRFRVINEFYAYLWMYFQFSSPGRFYCLIIEVLRLRFRQLFG
jgi:hypothetical protein